MAVLLYSVKKALRAVWLEKEKFIGIFYLDNVAVLGLRKGSFPSL